MSEIRNMIIVHNDDSRTEADRTIHHVRFLDAEQGKLLGDIPEVILTIEHRPINKYTDRYVVTGAVITNIAKEVTAQLLMVGLVKAVSELHQGRASFADQGFTVDVLAGIEGLWEMTYEPRDTTELRLVSTSAANEVEKQLPSLGFGFTKTLAAH